MITFYSRKYEVLAQASFDGNEGLIAYDDEFHDDLKTGIATYTFSIDKTDDTIANIELGCYIRVLTFRHGRNQRTNRFYSRRRWP